MATSIWNMTTFFQRGGFSVTEKPLRWKNVAAFALVAVASVTVSVSSSAAEQVKWENISRFAVAGADLRSRQEAEQADMVSEDGRAGHLFDDLEDQKAAMTGDNGVHPLPSSDEEQGVASLLPGLGFERPGDTSENIWGSPEAEVEMQRRRTESCDRAVAVEAPDNVVGSPEPEPESEITDTESPGSSVDTPENVVGSSGSEAEAETQRAEGSERSVETAENIVGLDRCVLFEHII